MASANLSMAAPIVVTVGDNDGYGFGVADNGTAIWPGGGTNGTNYDGRSGAEAAAINGAQFTDNFSALHPGFGPNTVSVGNFIFPFSGVLQSASLTVDMGDFQASTFGQVNVSFNGVLQPGLFNFNDGFQSTAVRAFVLSGAAIANANAAGQFVVTVDRNGSGDFIAFDYLQLNGELVPEPASLALWSISALGLAWATRRRLQNRQAA